MDGKITMGDFYVPAPEPAPAPKVAVDIHWQQMALFAHIPRPNIRELVRHRLYGFEVRQAAREIRRERRAKRKQRAGGGLRCRRRYWRRSDA